MIPPALQLRHWQVWGERAVVEKPTSADWVLGGHTNYFDGEPDWNPRFRQATPKGLEWISSVARYAE